MLQLEKLPRFAFAPRRIHFMRAPLRTNCRVNRRVADIPLLLPSCTLMTMSWYGRKQEKTQLRPLLFTLLLKESISTQLTPLLRTWHLTLEMTWQLAFTHPWHTSLEKPAGQLLPYVYA